MFERFTDRSRKVMALANQEAQRFNHEYIGTEHILLGLIKEGSGVGANVLKNLGVDFAGIRAEVGKLVKPGPDKCLMGKLPQTLQAKQVIEFAIQEARSLNHNYVGTEHLLLGLLRVQDDVAAQILANLGLTPEACRRELVDLLGKGENPSPTESTLAVSIDATDEFIHNAIRQLSLAWDRAFAKHDAMLANALRDQIQSLHAMLARKQKPPDTPDTKDGSG